MFGFREKNNSATYLLKNVGRNSALKRNKVSSSVAQLVEKCLNS